MNLTDDGSANSEREQPRTGVEDRRMSTNTSSTDDGSANKSVKPIPKKKKTEV